MIMHFPSLLVFVSFSGLCMQVKNFHKQGTKSESNLTWEKSLDFRLKLHYVEM